MMLNFTYHPGNLLDLTGFTSVFKSLAGIAQGTYIEASLK